MFRILNGCLVALSLGLCLSATLSAGDLSFRDAIVYVKADPVGNGYGMLSAVCVSEDGVFITAGHGGFTRGREYQACRGKDTEDFATLLCVSDRNLNDEAGEGITILKDVDPTPRHTFVRIGETPDLAVPVYGLGYAGGRMAYSEGMVIESLNGGRFICADFRMLNGASGGGLFDSNNRLVGILSSRSLLASEGGKDGPYTRWISPKVFKQCVTPFLKNGD